MRGGWCCMEAGCMSTTEPTLDTDRYEPDGSATLAPEAPLPSFDTPIVPSSTIAGRALVAVVAIMTFLACITAGTVMLVRAAASEWQSEVAREVTIQIRPLPGRDIEADIARAAAIAPS